MLSRQLTKQRHVDGSQHVDPVLPVTGVFGLGRPFGLLSPPGDACDPAWMPFGLRNAVVTPAVPIEDFAAYGYDHDLQVGMVRDGDRLVPLSRHTTGKTHTKTNPDGKNGPDSDTDHRED